MKLSKIIEEVYCTECNRNFNIEYELDSMICYRHPTHKINTCHLSGSRIIIKGKNKPEVKIIALIPNPKATNFLNDIFQKCEGNNKF